MSTPIEFDGTRTKHALEDLVNDAATADALLRELLTAPNPAAKHNRAVAIQRHLQRIVAKANAIQKDRAQSRKKRLKSKRS